MNNQNNGPTTRKKNKKTKYQSLIYKAISELKENLPYLFDIYPFDENKFMKSRVMFLQKIKESYSYDIYIDINNLIRDLIIRGIKLHGWKINIPRNLRKDIIKPQPRNAKWMHATRQFSQWITTWEKHLERTDIPKPSHNELIASIVISSICYGGLGFKEGSLSLINHLNQFERPLFEYEGIYWCDLIIKNKNFPSNVVIDDSNKSLRRWFSDNMTLMWINQYLLNRKNTGIIYTQVSLWKIVKDYILLIANQYSLSVTELKSLSNLCKTGFGITERLKGVKLNQALVGYYKGEIKSCSPQPEYWKSLLTNSYRPKKDDLKKRINEGSKNKKDKVDETRVLFYDKLNYIFTHPKNKKKPSKSKLLKTLNNLYTDNDNEFYILNWLIYHLEERNNKIGSVHTYFKCIGEKWLNAGDIDVYDPEQLEEFYQKSYEIKEYNKQIKENKKSNESKKNEDNSKRAYVLARLKDFHVYCQNSFGFPELSIIDNLIFSTDNFVRTGIISKILFNKFIRDYQEHSQDSHNYKNMMICLFIMMYRSGLRISEIKQLKISDIEVSDELWLSIRVNIHGTKKTYSSRRKLSLECLINQKERDYIINYVELKKIKFNVGKSSLLFSNDLTPNQIISEAGVQRIFNKYLKNKYGTHLVIHHMRHTALSTLYIIFSNNDYLISKITNYTSKEIKTIQQKFNSSGKNIFWNISKLAGHSTPESTFSSYIHFADFVLYSELINYHKKISFNELLIKSGCSWQYIKPNLAKLGKKDNEISLRKINLLLQNSLNKYTSKIKSSLIKSHELPTINYETRPSPTDCWLILKEIEKEQNMQLLANNFKVDEGLINRWVINAKHLSNLKTQKGEPRLFSTKTMLPKNNINLAPTLPTSMYERNISNKILNNAHMFWSNEFQMALKYFIKNSSTESGLSFTDPAQLKIFLSVLKNFFKKKYVFIEFTAQKGSEKEIKKQIAVWKHAISKNAIFIDTNKLVNKKYKFKNGKVTLKIPDPNDMLLLYDKNINKKEIKIKHSHILKFTFHLLAIMSLHSLGFDDLEMNDN